MSEHGSAPAPAAPAGKPQDPVQELAKLIYAQITGPLCAAKGGSGDGIDGKAIGKACLKLAEDFMQAYREVNAEALEIERRKNTFSADDLDMDSMMGRKK